MIRVSELRKWLKSLADDASVGIDDGGLTLCGPDGRYIEVGGLEEEEPEGGDLCDLCMASGVEVSRTTYCGKSIGIGCGCDENSDGGCDTPGCEQCEAGRAKDADSNSEVQY